MRSRFVLTFALLLPGVSAIAQSSPTPPEATTASPQTNAPQDSVTASPCAALSVNDPQLLPLSTLCVFALSFRHNLPDFICEQTTISTNDQPDNRPKIMQARVTYEKGKEHYSNIVVNGKPVQTNGDPPATGLNLFTAGEFGSDLVDLFTPPIVAAFTFHKKDRIRSQPAVTYEFRLAADKNTFWTIHGGGLKVNPEFRGELSVALENARLLHQRIEPVHLPPQFPIAAVNIMIDYTDVNLGDAGVFLLPTSSETNACVRAAGWGVSSTIRKTNLICIRNVVSFHNCRKFTAKARIVEAPEPR